MAGHMAVTCYPIWQWHAKHGVACDCHMINHMTMSHTRTMKKNINPHDWPTWCYAGRDGGAKPAWWYIGMIRLPWCFEHVQTCKHDSLSHDDDSRMKTMEKPWKLWFFHGFFSMIFTWFSCMSHLHVTMSDSTPCIYTGMMIHRNDWPAAHAAGESIFSPIFNKVNDNKGEPITNPLPVNLTVAMR